MDYDRNDALLHWIFRQTQGDAWFRPNEENISSGVALRVNDRQFLFLSLIAIHSPLYSHPGIPHIPLRNSLSRTLRGCRLRSQPPRRSQSPFRCSTRRSRRSVRPSFSPSTLSIHPPASSPEDSAIYVDSQTQIQILDSILLLPHADREQSAAFIVSLFLSPFHNSSYSPHIPARRTHPHHLVRIPRPHRSPLPRHRRPSHKAPLSLQALPSIILLQCTPLRRRFSRPFKRRSSFRPRLQLAQVSQPSRTFKTSISQTSRSRRQRSLW